MKLPNWMLIQIKFRINNRWSTKNVFKWLSKGSAYVIWFGTEIQLHDGYGVRNTISFDVTIANFGFVLAFVSLVVRSSVEEENRIREAIKVIPPAMKGITTENPVVLCNKCGKKLPLMEPGEGKPCSTGYLCRKCFGLKDTVIDEKCNICGNYSDCFVTNHSGGNPEYIRNYEKCPLPRSLIHHYLDSKKFNNGSLQPDGKPYTLERSGVSGAKFGMAVAAAGIPDKDNNVLTVKKLEELAEWAEKNKFDGLGRVPSVEPIENMIRAAKKLNTIPPATAGIPSEGEISTECKKCKSLDKCSYRNPEHCEFPENKR